MAICGVLAAISGGVYLIFVRYRKFGVINPWATGLSGHLKNAFVTGSKSFLFLYIYIFNLVENMLS